MMKFMRKSKGFISIFLCIVLLPMVTFSALVIDVSRLQNARTLVTSAGDLAMNAGMSEYNKTLQEMYGIFATSTSDKELENALSNYFTKTIEGSIGTSNIGEKEYIQKYAQEITHWLVNTGEFDNAKFSNFIEMELAAADADGSFEYLGVNNSSPANPAIMKQQIIDYMKYKGPVSLSMNLFNKIGALKESKKQLEVVEKKVDYTQTLDNLTDPCEKAFTAIYGDVVEQDASPSTYGYNDYVHVYNTDYLSPGKDYENGLLASESKAYKTVEENLQKMSVFLIFNLTARISAGELEGPTDKAKYFMIHLKGLDYKHFDNYLQTHPDKYGGYAKYSSITKMSGCTSGFEELLGKINSDNKLTVKDGDQALTFTDTNFDKYFKKGQATVKTTTTESSEYNNKIKYINKAELVADTAILLEDNSNVSSELLKSWVESVKSSPDNTYDNLSLYDGKTYDLILQELDQGKKWESVLEFMKYKYQIIDLKNKFNSTWDNFKSEVDEDVNEEKDHLKTKYDYSLTVKGAKTLVDIDTYNKTIEEYEKAETGKIPRKVKELNDTNELLGAKYSEISSLQTQYNNEKDAKKKEELDGKIKAAEAEAQVLSDKWDTLDGELKGLEAERDANVTKRDELQAEYDAEVEKRNKAAESDAELIKRSENNYYEVLMMKEIINKLASQVETLNKTLKDDVLDKLPKRVKEFYEHGKPFLKTAIQELEKFYVCVCHCHERAETSQACLLTVEEKYKDVQAAYNSWKDSANAVEDQTTKTTMVNDVNTTTSGIKKKDIIAARKAATQRKIYFSEVKTMVENIRFFNDVHLVDKDQGVNFKCDDNYVKKIYDALAKHDKNTGFGDVDNEKKRNSGGIKGDPGCECKSAEIVKNHFKDTRSGITSGHNAFSWKPESMFLATDSKAADGSIYNIYYGDPMEGEKNTSLTSTVSYDVEQFFKVLVMIAKPKKNNSDEDQQKVDKVQEVKQDAVDNKKPDGTVTQEKSTAEEVTIGEDVVKNAQDRIDSYGSNGGNAKNGKDAGDKRKDFELSDDKDKYKDNSDKAKNSLNQSSNILTSLANIGTNVLQDAYLEEYFTEMFTCQTDVLEKNKGNKMLNGATIEEMYKKDTAWYGGEMEYIIWGDSISSAKVKNEVAIYAIRLALNAIYAFTAADIQQFAFSAASAVAGWCPVAIPLVQVLITIGLAVAESAIDLIKLKNGEDVPVYKSTDSFVCSPAGALKEGAKTLANYAIDVGVTKAKEAVNKAVDNISQYGTDTLEKRWAEVEKLRDSYLDEQKENISSSLKNMIATPLINAVKPVIMLKEYAYDTYEEDIDNALKGAFTNMKKIINDKCDGAVESLAYSIITKYENPLKAEIKNELKGTVTIEAISKFINRRIDYYIGEIDNEVKGKLDEVGKKFMEEAEKCKTSLCGNVKELTNKWTTKAGEKLTSSATSFIDNKLDIPEVEDLGITKKTGSGAGGGLTLNYKEYCKIFVLLGLIDNNNEASMLQRCAALCEANVKNPGSKFKEDSGFEMDKVNTVVAVHAKVKLGTLFPWGVTVKDNGSTNTTDLGFSHLGSNSVIIDYQGVNAY